MSKRFKLGVAGLMTAALLAFAPGAFASTVSESTGTITWTAANGIANNTTFTDTATTITIDTADDPVVYDDLAGTSSQVTTNCVDDAADDTSPADSVTCTVPAGTRLVANSGDQDDTADASSIDFHPVTLNTGTEDDTGYGGALDDTLNGGDGADNLQGEAGADTIDGGAGDDNLYGLYNCCGPSADGADTITGGPGYDYATGGPGNDSIDLGDNDDNGADGGPGDDTITGGGVDPDPNISYNGSNGTLKGGPGNDTINAGDGDETVYGDCNGGCNAGAPGNDTVDAGAGDDNVRGEAGDDTLNLGAGDDAAWGDCPNDTNCSSGSPGDDVINGGDGEDSMRGQVGNDTVNGDAGDDNDIIGGPGNDSLHGGDGSDDLYGDGGTDVMNGDAGDDYIDAEDNNGEYGPDTINGGPGFDRAEWDVGCGTNGSVVVTLDDQANDSWNNPSTDCGGDTDPNNNFGSDIEQLELYTGDTPVTAVGNGGPNAIYTDEAADILDGGAGPDSLNSGSGPDTVNAVDGAPDLVNCGDGTDTANVDQFDTTYNCETVNVRAVTSQYAPAEDAPPQVAWVTPAVGSRTISSKVPTLLEVNAADDKGISKVEFYAGLRLICTVTAAPYRCSYLPAGTDYGRTTITARAYDTSGQTATAQNQVLVPRFAVRSLSSKVSPSRDRSAPFRFTTSGRLSLPSNVAKAQGCSGGIVSIQFRAGKKTVSTRRVALTKSCTYKSRVTFKIPSRLRPKTLNVHVRFGGNAVMTPKSAKTRKVKTA